ncbi:uncharacterized protein LOC105686821 isoform X2 [Athalia rosae]|uniref:uncharacterized protein LOC105686821 isoform X2 n=1 Tax=Athalia rosae TaxID=37344 RepID=UPI0020332B99|nr:uncharacterized protein LOC105686821 isoform X2 [Athalia rosae]
MSSAKSKEIADEYISSLSDLTINSKPLINMLTMLAEDNVEHATAIVQAVETHLQKVRSDIKLPVLYLIDSIVKNVNGAYTNLFTQNIVNTFCGVFEKVDESTRASMWKLRQTWNEVFPAKKLFSLDVRVQSIDPAWPITASPTSIPSISTGSIHVNPRFLSLSQTTTPAIVPPVVPPAKLPASDPVTTGEAAMRAQLMKKKQELLELQRKKIELELLQATASLEQQQRQLDKQVTRTDVVVPTLHVAQTMESAAQVKPIVAPIVPSQMPKNVSKQFPAATASLLKNAGTNNGPRIAPASSIAVASARPVSRDPRLKPAVSAPDSASSNIDPRLRVATAGQKDPRLDNQSLAPPPHNVTNTVLSEQLKQQITSKQAVTSTINKPSSNLASSDTSMINASNNNNGNTNLNNNNNKNFSGNANKDAVSHRTSQKKDPRSSSNSSSSNNLNGNNSKVVQGQFSGNTTSSTSSIGGSSRGSGGTGDSKSKEKSFGTRQSASSLNEKTSASSKSSHRKVGNKSRSKQPQGSPSKVPKVERENSPPRSKSNEKDSEDSSVSIRTSPQSSCQVTKSRKKNSSKSRKRSSSPSYRIPRRNDAKSNSSLSSSGGVTEEEQSGSLIVSPPHPPTFKEIRSSARQRNYIRRNRGGSLSPENTTVVSAATLVQPSCEPLVDPSTKDEDLRSTLPLPTPPVPVGVPEKKDLDLRVLAVGASKRQSSEHMESSTTKKTKAEKFDALFGNEDVDLRTLTHPSAGRPPTPPPPIISGEDGKDGWAKLKIPVPKGPREKQSNSSDEKRERDRDRDRLGRPRLYSKLPDDPKERRRTLSTEDNDTRTTRRGRDSEKTDRNADRNIEIIMKQAAEQLNQGSITKIQYNNLIQEVLQMSEDQKLRAAVRKEKEGTSIVWEKGGHDIDRTPTFSPSSDNEGGRGSKDSKMSRNSNREGRWPGPQPWQSVGPWSHSAGPFPGPQSHFNVDYRPLGPWQGPRHYGPIRPDFNQYHGGFNQSIGPNQRMGPGMIGSMSANGPMIQNLLANGPIGPMSMSNAAMASGLPMTNINGPASMMMNNGSLPPPNVLSNSNAVSSSNIMTPSVPGRNISPNISAKYDPIENDNDFGGTLVKNPGAHTRELPAPDAKILDQITKDTMKSISIDGIPREIRYYGDTGVVFMNWDDPREIGFQDGVRRILIDEKDTVTCAFNGDYKEFIYEGEVHKIKLGAPTRELWVDDRWYECYFGGPSIKIFLSGKNVSVELEGPPPQVKIGIVKRTDLVVAKINLIINARNMVPVFLDAKPQIFEIEGKPNTLEFADSLQTVLLNGRPFKVEFGGLPKPIVIRDKKHFIRFSVLPRGIRAGYVKIFGMRGESPIESPPTPPVLDTKATVDALPIDQHYPSIEQDSGSQDGSDLNQTPKPDLQLDILSSVLPSAMAPASGLSYQAEQGENTATAPTLPLNLNMDELFQRLVATGIVPTLNTEQNKKEEEEKEPEIIPVSFDKPETLKLKQPAMAAQLYSGMQCSSCGARFAPELATRYSHHLDWHFRQNRRERDSARKAHSRPWYYDVSDWIQYEEIEDLEDRAQSWFETEKQTAETEGAATDDSPQETVQPSVPTSNNEDTQCQVCHDAFEQFYNEEKEEWHLRPAINFEGNNYHPLCLEDHKEKSLARSMDDSTTAIDETIAEVEEEKKKSEDLETADTESKPDVEESDEKPAIAEEPVAESKNKEEPEKEKAAASFVDKESEIESVEAEADKESGKDVEAVDQEGIPHKIEFDDFADVKIKEEPIDEHEIEDDGTQEEFIFSNVEIKTEPVDPEPDPEETVVNEPALVDTTHTAVKSSIDGNVELESAPTSLPAAPSRIKINITKPLNAAKETDEPKDKPNPEIPDIVKPELLKPALVKPSLQGKKLSTLPPVEKGHELSGLCSIM